MLSHRTATSADIPALLDLVDSAYRGDRSRAGWTTEADLLGGQRTDAGMLADMLADPKLTVLVIEQASSLCACVAVEQRADCGYISMLCVQPTVQAAGIGRQILTAAEGHILDTYHLPCARMSVIAQREDLIGWYGRRGYHRTGESLPFPYGNKRIGEPKRDDLSFLILEKRLS